MASRASEMAADVMSTFRSGGERTMEALRSGVAQQRPWLEMADRLSVPANGHEAVVRIRKNTSYFYANYATMFIVLFLLEILFFSHRLLSSFLWLLVILSVYLWFFVLRPDPDHPVSVLGYDLDPRYLTLIFVAFAVLTVSFLTTLSNILFGSLFLWALLTVLHAAFRDPDDLYIVDDDISAHPFLWPLRPFVPFSRSQVVTYVPGVPVTSVVIVPGASGSSSSSRPPLGV